MMRYLDSLEAIAPNGYSVGLHIRFAAPAYVRSTYPQGWRDKYMGEAYGLRDPLVFWGVARTGVSRWSEIDMPDPFGILDEAARHGLRYGAIASVGKITSRSMVGIARGDRECTDAELAQLEDLTRGLHEVGEPLEDLPASVVEALRLEAEGTAPPGGPESADAHAARLTEARDILGTPTTAEAIRMARYHRLI